MVGVRRVDHEVVVVGTCHDILCIAREDNLEFVEDAVIFIGVAQTRSKMFVDRNGLDGLALHVDVPDLDSEVVTGEDITAIMGESDIRDGRDDF